MDRVVLLGWTVQNLFDYHIFYLEGYEMSENERRGERSQERTSSPVRLNIDIQDRVVLESLEMCVYR